MVVLEGGMEGEAPAMMASSCGGSGRLWQRLSKGSHVGCNFESNSKYLEC